MHPRKTTYLLIASTLVFAVGFGFVWWQFFTEYTDTAKPDVTQQAYLTSDGQCLRLAVAETPQERQEGLSNYDSLKADQGMLFLYDQPGTYGFWMKDMDFAIDIIWLDENNRVVTIKQRVQPKSFPQTFKPDQPAKKVIETPAGWTQKQNINSGDQLTLVGPTTTTPVDCGSD